MAVLAPVLDKCAVWGNPRSGADHDDWSIALDWQPEMIIWLNVNRHGFRATKHQSFVGAGYFDAVQNTIMAGASSTTAMDGSTEEEQFVA